MLPQLDGFSAHRCGGMMMGVGVQRVIFNRRWMFGDRIDELDAQHGRVVRDHANRARKCQRALHWQQAAEQQNDQTLNRQSHEIELSTAH